MNNKTSTLSEFLLQTGTQIRLFDLGRRVSKISLPDFQKFEQADLAYPFPYEQTAWIGLIYWNNNNYDQHNIWFIRMPLDETGHLQISARDEFMHLLLSRFSEHMQNSNNTQALTHVLKDNPYVFKPTEDKMAIFHAKALLILQQSPTQYFTPALKYLQANDYRQWQHIGIQGIADVAVRQDKKEIQDALLKAIPLIPDQVFNILCQNLENETINIKIAKAIESRFIHCDNEQLIANGIRAIASCKSSQYVNDITTKVLTKQAEPKAVILVAIAAKNWEALFNENILKIYLNKLSQLKDQPEIFNALILDLMFMPGLREKILREFRNPNRSDSLSKAVGTFFQTMG